MVHRDLRHSGMDPQPEEDRHRSRNNCVVPPTASLACIEFAAGLCGDDRTIVEVIAVALAFDRDIA